MFKLYIFKNENHSGIELSYKTFDEASRMTLQFLKQGYVVRIELVDTKKVKEAI